MRDEGKPELMTKGTSCGYFERHAEGHVVQIISISSFKALVYWIHTKYSNKQDRQHNGRGEILTTFISGVSGSGLYDPIRLFLVGKYTVGIVVAYGG